MSLLRSVIVASLLLPAALLAQTTQPASVPCFVKDIGGNQRVRVSYVPDRAPTKDEAQQDDWIVVEFSGDGDKSYRTVAKTRSGRAPHDVLCATVVDDSVLVLLHEHGHGDSVDVQLLDLSGVNPDHALRNQIETPLLHQSGLYATPACDAAAVSGSLRDRTLTVTLSNKKKFVVKYAAQPTPSGALSWIVARRAEGNWQVPDPSDSTVLCDFVVDTTIQGRVYRDGGEIWVMLFDVKDPAGVPETLAVQKVCSTRDIPRGEPVDYVWASGSYRQGTLALSMRYLEKEVACFEGRPQPDGKLAWVRRTVTPTTQPAKATDR